MPIPLWEYQITFLDLTHDRLVKTTLELNMLGAEGWELMSTREDGLSIFKRPASQ